MFEQLSEASRAAEQDLYAEYPKLPRKAKKELKKRLNAVNNAYCVGITLLLAESDGL